jgi:hypothetical protein
MNLPVADLICMQVSEGCKQLLHNSGSLHLIQMLVLNDVVEELTSLTVPMELLE